MIISLLTPPIIQSWNGIYEENGQWQIGLQGRKSQDSSYMASPKCSQLWQKEEDGNILCEGKGQDQKEVKRKEEQRGSDRKKGERTQAHTDYPKRQYKNNEAKQ